MWQCLLAEKMTGSVSAGFASQSGLSHGALRSHPTKFNDVPKMRKHILPALLLLCAGVLSACGGGGSSPAAAPQPVPTVALAFSQSRLLPGATTVLTWSSTNATSCSASGAWSGVQPASGSLSVTPASSGAQSYTLTCTSAGGSASASAPLTVTIPVLASSYENKAAAGQLLGTQQLPSEAGAGNAVAFADFFQDGAYAMVTHSLEYNSQDASTANKLGHIHFWKKVNGEWIDKTSALLANNVGCLHPRKAVVADFNADGKPDVFFACHGFDAPPFPGESPVIMLSQADGSYRTSVLPVKGFFHSAAAADINGDGYPDVLVADNMSAGQPYFLINNKDGTFTPDMTRLPADTKYQPIFTTELIDFGHTGKYDVFLGGHEQQSTGNWQAAILPNDGTGNFAGTARVLLPQLPGFGFPTDIAYDNGAIYLARTVDDPANFYKGAAIQKISYPSLASQSLYQHTTPYSSGTYWINWIVPYQGSIVTMDSLYGVVLPE